MPDDKMVFSGKKYVIQAMPLTQGLINLTSESGTKENISIVDCVVDGEITITWPDDTSIDVSFVEGSQKAIRSAKSVAVKSGTFNFA